MQSAGNCCTWSLVVLVVMVVDTNECKLRASPDV